MSTPDYYKKNGIECIDIIKLFTLDVHGVEGFILGNVIKYLWRYKFKNGIEDIDKAINYLIMLKSSFKTKEPKIYDLNIFNTVDVEKYKELLNKMCKKILGETGACNNCPIFEKYPNENCDFNAISVSHPLEFYNLLDEWEKENAKNKDK